MGDRVAGAPSGTIVGASVVLLVKAGLGLWGAYALLTASPTHHRWYLGSTVTVRHAGLGLALGLLAVVSIVVAVALLRLVFWARLGAFVLEGVGALLAVSRLVSHPGSSLLSLALSFAVIGLLLVGSSARQFSARRHPAAGS